jgi:hypothetical protein
MVFDIALLPLAKPSIAQARNVDAAAEARLLARNRDRATEVESASQPTTCKDNTVKTETFEGVMENAYSKKLDTPIKFSGTYQACENKDEIPANKLPTDNDIVDWVNNKEKANARQKAMQTALDAAGIVRPTLENDSQLRLKKMYDILVANGSTEDEARAIASTTLKLNWE